MVWSSYIFYARAYLLCIICFICLGMCFFLSVPELKENILLNGWFCKQGFLDVSRMGSSICVVWLTLPNGWIHGYEHWTNSYSWFFLIIWRNHKCSRWSSTIWGNFTCVSRYLIAVATNTIIISDFVMLMCIMQWYAMQCRRNIPRSDANTDYTKAMAVITYSFTIFVHIFSTNSWNQRPEHYLHILRLCSLHYYFHSIAANTSRNTSRPRHTSPRFEVQYRNGCKVAVDAMGWRRKLHVVLRCSACRTCVRIWCSAHNGKHAEASAYMLWWSEENKTIDKEIAALCDLHLWQRSEQILSIGVQYMINYHDNRIYIFFFTVNHRWDCWHTMNKRLLFQYLIIIDVLFISEKSW